MISVNLSNIRSAEVSETSAGPYVTLRFGSSDRAIIFTRSLIQAQAIALAVNGEVDAAMQAEELGR